MFCLSKCKKAIFAPIFASILLALLPKQNYFCLSKKSRLPKQNL